MSGNLDSAAGPAMKRPPTEIVNETGPIRKTGGRRKIPIEFIEDKSRRTITFSKRKAGIMKKAFELSTLTGTQVLLLVASETGHVYTFATPKLQPLITKPEGKNLIQACLNAPDNAPPQQMPHARHPGYSDVGGVVGYPDMQNPEMLNQMRQNGYADPSQFPPYAAGGVYPS
eukprot:Awhi_evm1s7803